MSCLRKKRKEREHGEMVIFFDAVRWMINRREDLSVSCHIPNESKSSIARRMMLKRAGLKGDAPTSSFQLQSQKYAGLFIEMKVKPNRPSKEQAIVLKQLNANGYLALVCWSGEEAIDTLNKYLAE